MRNFTRSHLRTLALLAVLLAVPGAGATAAADRNAGTQRYVVQVAPETLDAVAERARILGGEVVARYPTVDAAVVNLPADAVGTFRAAPAVVAAVPDARVVLQSSSYEAKNDANSMFNVSWVTGARRAWEATPTWPGYTGAGVDVALIDSGVAPVAGLDAPDKLLWAPDLSFESQNPRLAHLDTFGHGTHMAGIIAGRDKDAKPKQSVGNDRHFLGMAPDARVVSLKVADAYGATDVSQLIAAIDWVVQHRRSDGLNIRVLNLSFALPSRQPYTLDPLAHAAEVAWRKGIVVVAAAGNGGTGTGKLLSPAQDPYVIAAGAADSLGTISTEDDVIPAFSTRGDGVRNPDLVAHGASLQSLRVPGSLIDVVYGQGPGSIDGRFFRGSGTSQAAAVVSGAVAVLLEARPDLTPDEVKWLLVRTARKLPAADQQAQGAGMIDVRRALDANAKDFGQTFARSTGRGTLDGARGGQYLELDGVRLQGQQDIFAMPYESATHAHEEENEASWIGGRWNGSEWTGSTWAGRTWARSTWSGSTWAGSTWAGRTWADGTWTGRTWADATWAGRTWAGSVWAEGSWASRTWAIGDWR